MNCPSCGAENPDDKRFCGDCGTDIQSLIVTDTETGESRPTWTKQYKFLWMTWTIHGEVEDDFLETESSFLGVDQVTRTPRWLEVGGIKLGVGILAIVSVFLMATAYSATQDPSNFFFLFGALFLLASVGIGYLAYRIFYVPPEELRGKR